MGQQRTLAALATSSKGQDRTLAAFLGLFFLAVAMVFAFALSAVQSRISN